MLYVKVKYKGRRFNYYFQGDKKRLVELDDRGNEKSGSEVTEFADNELEMVPVFEADYVHSVRDEARQNREALDGVLKKLGLKDVAAAETFIAEINELREGKGKGGKDESETVKQLRTLLDDQRRQAETSAASLKKEAEAWRGKWKGSLKDAQLMSAVAIPKAAKPDEVKIILERYVDVDDEGKLSVFEDVAHTRKRLAPNGQPMTVKELAESYYKENPHQLLGHAAGGGSGGDGQGNGPTIDPKLPAAERLKQHRRQQAAGGA